MSRKIKRVLSVVAITAALFAAVGTGGRMIDDRHVTQLEDDLYLSARRPVDNRIDWESLSALPAPVARYFRHVLAEDQPIIQRADIAQSGVIRTSTDGDSWSHFSARQVVMPPVIGFLWDAKVTLPWALHVRVLDSYIAGTGAGRVSFLSALPVASDRGRRELDSGALHRYLAEGVWNPTSLLPQSGVVWAPMDDRAALATLSDKGTEVSLEFRFTDANEVVAIYSDGRYGLFDGVYKRVPWEGHFRDYSVHAGMRIPEYGEVGWYQQGELKLVWRGNLTSVSYQFAQ